MVANPAHRVVKPPGEVVYRSWRSPLLLVHTSWRLTSVDDQDLYTIVITTYIPPRQVGDGPWTPWYADYYHPAV